MDYVLSQAEDGECPYVNVSIYGCKMNGLLDSGANRIFLGQSGIKLIENLGIKIHKVSDINCTVANSQSMECLGYVTVPIQLLDKVQIFDIYLVPQLRHTLVLGTIFWIKMGLVPDLRKGEWYFGSDTNDLNINSIQCASDLNYDQKEQLGSVIQNYFDSIDNIKLGCCNMIKHEIKTDSPPIKSRYYPVSPAMQELINKEVDKMLELDVIEKSDSGWSSPILMVAKGDGTYRFCVDFRKLNAVTEKNAYPLPQIPYILDRLGNARYLSTLDIKSAYWQIPLSKQSRKYTAFTIPGRGLFHFKRLPFGLTNAPATFQELVDKIFGPELEPYLFKYLDDFIIITPDFETHIRILNEVFRRLKEAGLALNKEKCVFCRDELKFLGYVINRAGLNTDPGKVSAIVDMPIPRTPRQVRQILGMVSWYRRFIPNMSTIVAPLTALTKKHVKFKWSLQCEEAFANIKNALISAPILSCPNFKYPFTVQCDASSYGVGAVLTQNIEGKENVICYLSRALTKNEQKMSITEKEIIAVIWACEKLRCYLELSFFTVITDHASLVWINNLKNPTGRLGRWALRLQQFNFEVKHRPGKDNLVPDCLSRIIPNYGNDNPEINNIETDEGKNDAWYKKMSESVCENPLKYSDWRMCDGKLYKHINDKLNFGNSVNNWKIVVPKSNRSELIRKNHDEPLSGHLGVYKTYHRILSRYYWPGMKSDINKYVKRCRICAATKPEQLKKAGEMGSKPEITRCWQYISTDLLGPYPRSTQGNRFILVVCDYFSKFCLMFPLRTATAAKVTKIMEEQIFLLFGVPEFLKADNGVQYKSKEFLKLMKDYKVNFLTNPLYCPEKNPTERYNRTFKTMLISYINDNQKLWDKNLHKLSCALRTAKSEITSNTPYFVNFGCEMILEGTCYKEDRIKMQDIQISNNDSQIDDVSVSKCDKLTEIRQFVKKKLQEAHERTKHNYNLRHRPVQLKVGDFCWKKDYNLSDASKNYSSRLANKFSGPYKIRKKLGINTYELIDKQNKSIGNWHISDLKPDSTLNYNEKW